MPLGQRDFAFDPRLRQLAIPVSEYAMAGAAIPASSKSPHLKIGETSDC